MVPVLVVSGRSNEQIENYIKAVKGTMLGCLFKPFFPGDRLDKGFEFHGLLLTGGGDIAEGPYYETSCGDLEGIVEERDTLEFGLLERALLKNIPILGICRGMQILNVFLGGKLYRDLGCNGYEKHNGTLENIILHQVKIRPSTILRDITCQEEVIVNSFHHQGISVLSKELRAIAYSIDGVLEAFEKENPFILGLQWHPERMIEKEPFARATFKLFMNEIYGQ